ncbi:hypothetical protein CFOL_v3_11126 [Cephalotus follicularis]|uniref:Uncharacterized protein n=1 Tax=Cephalotus follicularis TaxID=3775 RepID=A0A1Q3BI27_CEPFO|nr:hypothetical protein CFOL_v3_11126 [Cephalotus follicularis]
MLNLPLLILWHIREILNKDGRKWPYGGLLTRLFKLFGVPLEAEARESLKRTDIINLHTIFRMHWEKKYNVWVRMRQGDAGVVEAKPEDTDMEAPPIQCYASMETVLDYLHEMEGQLNVRMNSLDSKLDAHHQDHMKVVSELRTQFHGGFSVTNSDDDNDAGFDDSDV